MKRAWMMAAVMAATTCMAQSAAPAKGKSAANATAKKSSVAESGKSANAASGATKVSASSSTSNSAATPLPSEEVVEQFLKRTFGQDPSIQWRIFDISPSEAPGVAQVTVGVGNPPQVTRLYVIPGGEYAAVGELIPFGADPYAVNRRKLAAAEGPTRGAATAQVELVEFSDLQCPYCKAAQPIIEKLAADFPQTKLRFQNFPLAMHKWARKAADYGDCVAQQDVNAFWKYAQSVYDAQSFITEDMAETRLKDFARQAGADADKAAACATSPATDTRVNKSIDLGKSLGVNGTPTLFINGRKVTSVKDVPYDSLKAMVQFEIDQSQGKGTAAANKPEGAKPAEMKPAEIKTPQ